MKTIKLSFVFAVILLNSVLSASNGKLSSFVFNETPAKTIVIKNPAADDANTFFANAQIYNFEIFKAGDTKAIIQSILKDPDVEACIANNPIGDFTPIQLSLKKNKNKAWFIKIFKAAGLNTIRINRKDVVTVEKM